MPGASVRRKYAAARPMTPPPTIATSHLCMDYPNRRAKIKKRVSMMRTTRAALAIAIGLSAAAAMAQDLTGTLKKIRDSGTIAIGHRETSIPFSYLNVKLNPVTSQTRIPLVENGTIDLECGSTTNTLARQKQVAFSPVTFITGTKLVVKRASRVKSYKDLKGKTVVVTQGTTNERAIKALSDKENLGIKFLSAKDHDESFLTVASGRAVAFSMDDILLYGLVAKAKNPKDFDVVGDYLSYDPYGLMYRKNDDAFGVVVKRAIARLMGEPGQCNGPIRALYKKWFVDKLPSGESLNLPMSPLLEAVCRTNALPD